MFWLGMLAGAVPFLVAGGVYAGYVWWIVRVP
jgi:hypothetical protein